MPTRGLDREITSAGDLTPEDWTILYREARDIDDRMEAQLARLDMMAKVGASFVLAVFLIAVVVFA
jgi:hypothetical protein